MTFVPELLAPAGNMDKFRTCLLYGANAVYLGGKSGNLRSACEGLSGAELALAVQEAEAAGARVYYCLNSLAGENELASIPEQLENAQQARVHGLIVADPGVLRLAQRHAPSLPVHLSTQANTSNSQSVLFWAGQGISRVNLARELSGREIYAIRKACPDMELEVFVHGAMCLAVSGQCLLSAWLNGRSGNKGSCTQPCRFEYRALARPASHDCCENETISGKEACEAGYAVPVGAAMTVEEYTRPGEPLWRVERDERFSSFWAPWDLCLLPWLGWFAQNRINALKIEGRMKSAGWLAHVVDVYRCALDGLDSLAGRRKALMLELLYASSRPLGSGFFLHGKKRNLTEEFLRASKAASRSNRSGESQVPALGHRILARVLEQREQGVWLVEGHGNWRRDKDVEVLLPGMRRPTLIGGSYGLENQRGRLADLLGNGNRGFLYADMEDLKPGVFIREAQ